MPFSIFGILGANVIGGWPLLPHDYSPRPTVYDYPVQSIKAMAGKGKMVFDAVKKANRGKRHLLVDTIGLILKALLTPGQMKIKLF